MAVRYDLLNDFTDGVGEERDRQVRKFGDRAGEECGLPFVHHTSIGHDLAEAYWKKQNAQRSAYGNTSWDGILLEEVFEALAETDPEKMETELIQVASVCAAMYEDSRRRREDKVALAERQQRAEGKARHERDLEKTAEAREQAAIRHVEEMLPSVEEEARSYLEQNGYKIVATEGLPSGTVFFFDTSDKATVEFGPTEDLQPYVDEIDSTVRELARLYKRPTRPTEGVAWDELVGDPVIGGGIEETGIPAPQTYWPQFVTWNDFDPSPSAKYPGPSAEYADLKRRLMDWGPSMISRSRWRLAPETRPFGKCCPHGVQDPDVLLP